MLVKAKAELEWCCYPGPILLPSTPPLALGCIWWTWITGWDQSKDGSCSLHCLGISAGKGEPAASDHPRGMAWVPIQVPAHMQSRAPMGAFWMQGFNWGGWSLLQLLFVSGICVTVIKITLVSAVEMAPQLVVHITQELLSELFLLFIEICFIKEYIAIFFHHWSHCKLCQEL